MLKCKKIDQLRPKSLHMIRYQSAAQTSLKGFVPSADNLDENNRWVVLGRALSWDELAWIHHRALSVGQGRPALDARRVIGAMIIKHKLKLDDRGTVEANKENPYMQWFCGLSAFSTSGIFDASLMVTLRKRIGAEVFEHMNQAILDRVEKPREEKNKAEDGDPPMHKGELKIDATVAPQKIAYPTDLDLLNTSRECTEALIDALSKRLQLKKKPRDYRKGVFHFRTISSALAFKRSSAFLIIAGGSDPATRSHSMDFSFSLAAYRNMAFISVPWYRTWRWIGVWSSL